MTKQMKDLYVKSPRDVIPVIKKYSCKKQEYFGILCIDGGNKILSKQILFIGGSNKIFIDKKVVFWNILRKKPSGVILFHNHPSNNSSPSDEDVETTKDLKKGLDLLGLQLFDHVIITKYDYWSFLEHNMLI